MSALYGANKDEFVTCMAALALYDGGAELTSDNIKALLDASKNTVAPYWPGLFMGIFKDGKIEELLFSLGGGGGGGAGGDAGVAADAAGAYAFSQLICNLLQQRYLLLSVVSFRKCR